MSKSQKKRKHRDKERKTQLHKNDTKIKLDALTESLSPRTVKYKQQI